MDKIHPLPDIVIIDEEDLDELVRAILNLQRDLMTYPDNLGLLSSREEEAIDKHLDYILLAHVSLMDAKTQEEKKADPNSNRLQKIKLARDTLRVIELHFEIVIGCNDRVKATLGINEANE